jgi:hypothetical protein
MKQANRKLDLDDIDRLREMLVLIAPETGLSALGCSYPPNQTHAGAETMIPPLRNGPTCHASSVSRSADTELGRRALEGIDVRISQATGAG